MHLGRMQFRLFALIVGGAPALTLLARAMASHPRPALTVDTALVTVPSRSNNAKLLLVKRAKPPFQGAWALPGGFVDEGEALGTAAARELREETGIQSSRLAQVGAFGEPGRDPRGWTVSILYSAIVLPEEANSSAGDDAKEADWFDVNDLPPLAFDHGQLTGAAFANLRRRLECDDTSRMPLLPNGNTLDRESAMGFASLLAVTQAHIAYMESFCAARDAGDPHGPMW